MIIFDIVRELSGNEMMWTTVRSLSQDRSNVTRWYLIFSILQNITKMILNESENSESIQNAYKTDQMLEFGGGVEV